MKLCWITPVICALAAVGCDEFETEDTPVATLRGTLSLADGVPTPELDDVRLSILWNSFDSGDTTRGPGVCGGDEIGTHDGPLVLEQPLELELDSNFPAAFSVKPIARPPRAAIVPSAADRHVGVALGELVVYSDRNGNGRLDLRGLHDESADQVLGSGAGDLPSSNDHGLRFHIVFLTHHIDTIREQAKQGVVGWQTGTGEAGYSLIIEHTDFTTIPFRHADNAARPLNDSAPIEISLSATAYVQRWACRESCAISRELTDCPVDPAELLAADLGEQRTSEGLVGRSIWERIDGARTITTSTSCERSADDNGGNDPGREVFRFGRWTQEGCTNTYEGCRYERSQLPSEIDLPCTEYEELSLGPSPR